MPTVGGKCNLMNISNIMNLNNVFSLGPPTAKHLPTPLLVMHCSFVEVVIILLG